MDDLTGRVIDAAVGAVAVEAEARAGKILGQVGWEAPHPRAHIACVLVRACARVGEGVRAMVAATGRPRGVIAEWYENGGPEPTPQDLRRLRALFARALVDRAQDPLTKAELTAWTWELVADEDLTDLPQWGS